MHRLYLQIYLSLVAILILFSVLASVAWFVMAPDRQDQRTLAGFGAVIGDTLPGPDRPVEEARIALERLAERLHVDLALQEADGTRIAEVGSPLPLPRGGRLESGWMRGRGGPAVVIELPDGRWLVGRPRRHGHGFAWLSALGLLALVTALGAYPIVRRLTGRLERLRTRVEQLGSGDLSARVEVEGSDEVAALARSFNRAASRIEGVVDAQRTMLASASHELRSPLTRMRMALELLGDSERPELRDRVAKDINELDELIEELLLASRLDVLEQPEISEDVDLLALVAEEAALGEASLDGKPVRMMGDPRMLRRLVRNLLENARRYGNGTPIEVTLSPTPDGARLRVLDRGPGVPEPERVRIFEPFYRPAGLRESVDGSVGLGLALVRQIARHHRGEARCLPREGGGTCFEVHLAGAA